MALLHGSVQLGDFGMAKQLQQGERTFTICGTAQYMSPEVLLHRGCYFEAGGVTHVVLYVGCYMWGVTLIH